MQNSLNDLIHDHSRSNVLVLIQYNTINLLNIHQTCMKQNSDTHRSISGFKN